MPVNLEETIHYECIDISSEQLYDAMRQHRDVSTSQPSPGQLMELNVAKDARRGDLRKIVGGLARVPTKSRSLYGFMREGLPDEIKS